MSDTQPIQYVLFHKNRFLEGLDAFCANGVERPDVLINENWTTEANAKLIEEPFALTDEEKAAGFIWIKAEFKSNIKLVYDHAFDVAFSLKTTNKADEVTAHELYDGISNRLTYLGRNLGEIKEACGAPFNSYVDSVFIPAVAFYRPTKEKLTFLQFLETKRFVEDLNSVPEIDIGREEVASGYVYDDFYFIEKLPFKKGFSLPIERDEFVEADERNLEPILYNFYLSNFSG